VGAVALVIGVFLTGDVASQSQLARAR